MKTRAAILFGLATMLGAQTYVVDASNGPGTHFTTIAAAVAAVPDGAVLVVRAGTYAGFTVSGRGVSILANAGVGITSQVVVTQTQPHQAVTLRALAWTTAWIPAGHCLVQPTQCAGPVLIENVTMPANAGCHTGYPYPGPCVQPVGIYADHCAQIALRGCAISCTARFEDCDTAIESCVITGENSIPTMSGTYGRFALTVLRGHLQIAGPTIVRGGNGWPYGPGAAPPGVGVFMQDADLRVLDGQVHAGTGSNWAQPAITTSFGGTLRVSPRVVLSSPAPTTVMPGLTGYSAAPGGTLGATVTTEDGEIGRAHV